MKKLSLILCLVFVVNIFASLTVFADELPNAFWALNDKYTAAVAAKDNNAIIDTVLQVEKLLEDQSPTEQIREILASRYEQLIYAYERLGRYADSVPYLHKYRDYSNELGWADAVKIADAKILQYTSELNLYSTTGMVQSDYGAKNEPARGVLYGSTADGTLKGQNDSITLLYLEFGENIDPWTESVLEECSNNGRGIELAWNLSNEGDQVGNVVYQTEYITSILKQLEKYNNIPIYIRFGAEFDIWSNKADPEEFKSAFKHIANLARQYTTNTAMVWSVNRVSSWDINIDDYYPGDEYVDWVGISSYAQKYFLGRNDWKEEDIFNEIVFASGDNADGVKAISNIVEKYGNRKPIMIAEGGASYQIRTLNEDCTDWAKTEIERQYYYIPMVYPQVKLIAYFDKTIETEINEFNISKSPLLRYDYNKIVSMPQFIKQGSKDASTAYKKLADIIDISPNEMLLPVYAYVHTYKVAKPVITYYVDGAFVSSSKEIPYSTDLNLSGLSEGSHTLKVVADNGSSSLIEKSYTLNILPKNVEPVGVEINGEKVTSDVNPIIYNDRTLVPLRVISEKLGFDVKWNDYNQTITMTKGKTIISLTINNLIASVNDKETTLDVPPKIYNDRTMVPIRFVSEAMNYSIVWQDNKVLITTN